MQARRRQACDMVFDHAARYDCLWHRRGDVAGGHEAVCVRSGRDRVRDVQGPRRDRYHYSPARRCGRRRCDRRSTSCAMRRTPPARYLRYANQRMPGFSGWAQLFQNHWLYQGIRSCFKDLLTANPFRRSSRQRRARIGFTNLNFVGVPAVGAADLRARLGAAAAPPRVRRDAPHGDRPVDDEDPAPGGRAQPADPPALARQVDLAPVPRGRARRIDLLRLLRQEQGHVVQGGVPEVLRQRLHRRPGERSAGATACAARWLQAMLSDMDSLSHRGVEVPLPAQERALVQGLPDRRPGRRVAEREVPGLGRSSSATSETSAPGRKTYDNRGLVPSATCATSMHVRRRTTRRSRGRSSSRAAATGSARRPAARSSWPNRRSTRAARRSSTSFSTARFPTTRRTPEVPDGHHHNPTLAATCSRRATATATATGIAGR